MIEDSGKLSHFKVLLIIASLSFRWFSVIIYMVFLFLVAVIMLNLLIAQFSKSYEKISKTARQSVTPDRAKILVGLEYTFWILVRTIIIYYSL